MDNYLTVSQLAEALGVKRTGMYYHIGNFTTEEVDGVMCVSRHAALAYVEAKIKQHQFEIDRLQSAKADIMTMTVGEDDDE